MRDRIQQGFLELVGLLQHLRAMRLLSETRSRDGQSGLVDEDVQQPPLVGWKRLLRIGRPESQHTDNALRRLERHVAYSRSGELAGSTSGFEAALKYRGGGRTIAVGKNQLL